MHFRVLVEDQSGEIAVGHILKKILGGNGSVHSWRIHRYKGISHLLKDLPSTLQAFGNSLDDSSAVVVVVDSDDRDCIKFKQDLLNVLNACNPRPSTLFRIAIEEGEAWLLGDRAAVKSAYPNATDEVLNRYVQDSICGTWEVLADAIHPSGASQLKALGYPIAGIAKCDWARNIAPHMDVDKNKSKSFQVFRDGVRKLAGIQP